MHEFSNLSLLINLSPNLTHNHELHQGVTPPGLTYLTHHWRVKQGEGESEAQARHDAKHKCVCSNQCNKKAGCAVRAVVTVAPHCTAGQDR